MNKPVTDIPHPKMLLDPYATWAAKEGVPVTEDFGVDLLAVPTAPWPRFGIDGGLVHLKGRGDFVSVFVLDLAAGAKSAPQKHLFEEVVYVLSGHGNTTIETSDGRKHSFEWGPKSLFALPLNARYQHFQFERARTRAARLDQQSRAHAQSVPQRILCVRQRVRVSRTPGRGEVFQRGRRVHSGAAGPQHVGDQFRPGSRRLRAQGVGAARRGRVEHDVHPRRRHYARPHLADAGRYLQKGASPRSRFPRLRRHRARFLAAVVRDEKDFVRIDWKHGWVFAPPDQMFHQHFNTAPDPARYLAIAFGSLRYPFTADKRRVFLGMDVSVKDGGCQIEYEHQDPRIHGIYLEELAKHRVPSGMGKFIDERPYVKTPV